MPSLSELHGEIKRKRFTKALVRLQNILTANSIIKELKKLGTPAKAKSSAWFFKTGEGEYGYGDVFFGVTVPEQRTIVRRYGDLPLEEIGKLLQSKVHECRLTGLLILVQKYTKGNGVERKRIVRFYLLYRGRVNNWDLVDGSAPYLLGEYLVARNKHVLYKLAKSKNLWDRRIAIVATAAFIKKNHYHDTLQIAEILLHDRHDLIQKAVGWMLREVGNRSIETELQFLDQYHREMPRTMLRYAIEKFPKKKRDEYLRKI